ncbi:mechanosensitive ion channel family protein [Pukyongiella litopenaei]|uniref:Mechanosensitive ion channel n=1 Tax=Pukyongiella litopenaei TaxID=2605946 RepID=A0A2S0MQ08_9RHOB|nr:mechanosensitive ion channel domain-containing protein [Pukyongiella litopenaei]AVO37831.1 mechanosensitive ion channel [Pukyongiella litopenaei]
MTEFLDQLIAFVTLLWDLLQSRVSTFLVPGWRQNQLFILLAILALAFLARTVARPRLQVWARARVGWQKWQLRLLVQIRQRLALVFFVIFAWTVYLVMQQITWPSRSYLIGFAATLASVWLGVALVARMVPNRSLRLILAWSVWIYMTIYYLGLADEFSAFLESLAINIGSLHLSMLTILTALVLFAVLLTGARLGSQTASRMIRRNSDISPSMQVLSVKVVQVLLYGAVFLLGFRAIGFDLTGFALLSGAVGVGIGFGLQKVVSNLISGVIILLDKSIKPGDVISLGDTFGWINELGARYVSVVTRDGREHLIPNEDLITSQVVNWSHSDQFVRLDIFFGTAYGDDPHLVRRVAIEAAAGVPRVLSGTRAPVCHITGFGDSSVDYVLRFWITDPTGGLTNIKGRVYLALWDAFHAQGISFPFPQREVRLLGGEGATMADD